ncbi:VgrG-related protein [Actinophytocola glycyrrhizae]|uniref:VgrG-related protein n=1 Tax=Actinophytocola glycyrrhizae TaxID=2044873 RepID=A0ABV9S939_9PSEU
MTAATGRPVPAVSVGATGTPLPAHLAQRIARIVVDSHRHLPDMLEITFHDRDGTILDEAGIRLGTVLTVSAARAQDPTPHTLLVCEVTAIEGVYAESNHTVVRGYSADHRLMRARRSATFLNATDSDIARRVATGAGLRPETVDPTPTHHEQVAQVNQTDWEFLRSRATETGFDFGVRDGRFFLDTGGAPAPPVPLRCPHELRTFLPRVTAGNLAAEAEVRVWDPIAGKVVSATTPTAARSVDLPDTTAASAARPFAAQRQTPSASSPHGPEPVPGHVVTERPVANGAAIHASAAHTAGRVAEHWGDTFAEAEGEAKGDPRLRAGTVVEVSGVPKVFCGRWTLTRARHVFDQSDYYTQIEVSGRHDRSIIGLVTGTRHGERGRFPGLVCGVVSNIADPLGKGRVKVDVPLLAPGFQTDWAPVAQFGAGARGGALFGHEVGDEVLVGFECADPRRPYVLGGLVNDDSGYTLGGPAVRGGKTGTALVRRGFVSPSGNRLTFHDDQGAPRAAEIVLGTAKGDVALVIDQVAGTITVRCDPENGAGAVVVECGAGGSVDVRAGAGGSVTVDGGSRLDLSAQTVRIAATGEVAISGKQIKLN